jgi:hypothetical protein
MKYSGRIPIESLVSLQIRRDSLPNRCAERRKLVEATASLYGVSSDTVRRALRQRNSPKSNYRADRGQPRKVSKSDMENYCEIIAAIKMRTTNKKGRHLSTIGAIEILETSGVTIKNSGLVKVSKGLLTKSTVNHYLKKWGYNHSTLTRESPAARFQAEFSNDIWHFDLSPSDLKHLETPPDWVESGSKNPTLMLYSIADDRSGTCYQEYHCVYGEDTEAALRFLFNAMSIKSVDGFPFQGRPKVIHMDNGPISKNRTFLRVMDCLEIQVVTHLPKGADERRTTARAKGKIERPFRTVKEAHETLYHFRKPETEEEANRWLYNYLIKYNNKLHREEPHSRIEDWFKNHPPEGIRDMCDWARFITFAREPEPKIVGNDARINVDGVSYEVEPDLAGSEVILWWGLFDNQLFVQLDDRRYGPYHPIGKLSTLSSYRRFKKTKTEERADRISTLAKQLDLPHSALERQEWEFVDLNDDISSPVSLPFCDPDPFEEFTYPSVVIAKRAIADYLGQPIMRLQPEQRAFIDEILSETLIKKIVMARVSWYFQPSPLPHLLEFSSEEQENYVN